MSAAIRFAVTGILCSLVIFGVAFIAQVFP